MSENTKQKYIDDKKILGKVLSEEIGQKLLLEIQEKNLRPSLGILCVGNDPASLSFISVKRKFGEKYGFEVNLEQVSESGLSRLEDSQDFKEHIKGKLIELQKENDAVILQLPLPENLKKYTEEILSVIEKNKDVDNLAGGNFEAPIVLALNKILENTPSPSLKKVGSSAIFGIVGLGQVVGLPIYNYLLTNKYKVITIEKENFHDTYKCDVLISGVGQANLIKTENIKENAILIDYGCSWEGEKFCGDFDKSCYSKCQLYTPVPGCMGPLVVASLFENVFKTLV